MAALTLSAGGVVANFLTVKVVQGGFLSGVPTLKSEVLETPGVSGRRWRSLGYQMEPAVLECVADGTNWTTALTLADTYRSMAGFFGSLALTTGGVLKNFKDVYVSNIEATPIAGNVTGGGASANSTAHIRAVLVLEATDFSGGA